MSLHLVATPIGDSQDITLRAIEILKSADVVIGEERKEVSKLLKSLGISDKRLELLNEHSRDLDLKELTEICAQLKVALVTDCGTPGFCDPGAKLVAACRTRGVSVSPVPGPSSLMCLLSVVGDEMREFLFRGFLPAEREERAKALKELGGIQRPVILMDTPYRLERLLSELNERWPSRRAVIGCDFTQATEEVRAGTVEDLQKHFIGKKAEFILALFPMQASHAQHGQKVQAKQVTTASPTRPKPR